MKGMKTTNQQKTHQVQYMYYAEIRYLTFGLKALQTVSHVFMLASTEVHNATDGSIILIGSSNGGFCIANV